MAKKKKSDRPGRVNICFEQLIFDLDFMSNEYAGIILKMIVWYSAGTSEGKQRIEQMRQYIDSLPLTDKAWLTSTYKRLFKAIDDDFNTYADKCEKNRQIALEREERRRKREQETTNVHEREQETTNVHEREQETTNVHERERTYTNNNNNNNNKLSKDNNNNSHSLLRACEEKIFDDAWDSEQWREDVRMRHDLKPPELEARWKEFIMHRKASDKRNDSYRDIREHFNLWLYNIYNNEKNTKGSKNNSGASRATLEVGKDFKPTFDV